MREPKHVQTKNNDKTNSDSDSGKEFNQQFNELLGNYAQLWQKHQNLEKAKKDLHQDYNMICDVLGDLLVPLLCITWAMSKEIKQADQSSMLQNIKSQMCNAYYANDEYDTVLALCESKKFTDELQVAVKRFTSTSISIESGQFDEIVNKKLLDHFAASSPISPDKLTTLARTVDKDNYQCFVNPSKSIKNHWKDDTKWYRYCYAALELSRRVNHQNALSTYRWFGHARYQIGALLKHTRDNVVFGRSRLDTLYGLGSVFYTQISNYPDSAYYDQFSFCSKKLSLFENVDNNDCFKQLSINIGEANNKKTFRVTLILDPVTKVALCKIYRTEFMSFPCIVIGHPPAIHIDTVFKKSIEPLYAQILASNDLNLIYDNLGKIVWYYFQLMPAEGGSSAITQMCLFDLLQKKNLTLTPISGDISLDFLAIFEPDRDKFAKEFRQLFVSQNTLKLGM